MFSNKLNYRIINITALLLLLYIGVSNIGVWWGIITSILSIMMPFIAGFGFAYAFTPIIKWLQKKGIRKALAVTIVVIALVLIVVGLFAVTLPLIYDQLTLLAKMVLEVFDNIGDKFNINLGNFEITVEDYLNDIVKNIGNLASSTTIDILSKSVDFVTKFIVGFVAFVYFLADMDKIRKWCRDILISMNKRAYEYFVCIDNEIGNYLKGLAIFMIIQLFEYSILFFIVGHPNWLILGILACLTTVIPYFGGLITNVIAIITASVVSTPLVIATIVICLIFPQLDGYLISPRVYGKTNNVNALITIMVVSIGGTVAGVVGIIIALPCYLLIRTTYHFFKSDLKKGMVIVKETI